MEIAYNEPESAAHKVTIGNIHYNSLTDPDLTPAIIKGKYDIIKVHNPLPYSDIVEQLNKLNIPYVIHYQSILFEMDVQAYKGQELKIDTEYNFEFKLASYTEEIEKFARKSIDVLKGYYGNNPLTNAFYPADKILDLHAKYVANFNRETNSASIYMGYDDADTAVAFATFTFGPDNSAVAYLGGTSVELRNKRVGYLIHKKIIEDIMIPLGVKKYVADINILNTPSILSAQLKGYGFMPKSNNTRILLFPLANVATNAQPVAIPTKFTRLYNNNTGNFTTGNCYQLVAGPYSLYSQELLNGEGIISGYNYYEVYE